MAPEALHEAVETLEANRVFMGRDKWTQEPMLTAWINEIVRSPTSGEISPEVTRIYDMQRGLSRLPAPDVMRILIPELVGYEALTKKPDALSQVHRADSIQFSAMSHPSSGQEAIETVMLKVGHLAIPRVDTAFGYLPSRIAKDFGISEYPLDEIQEGHLKAIKFLPVCRQLHFPFLTWQAKAVIENESFGAAECEGARVGCSVVYSMLNLLLLTGNKPLLHPAICHFSSVLDGRSLRLYLHWACQDGRGSFTYEMDVIAEASISNPHQLQLFRQAILKIIDWALTERLHSIKAIMKSSPASKNTSRGLAIHLDPSRPPHGLPSAPLHPSPSERTVLSVSAAQSIRPAPTPPFTITPAVTPRGVAYSVAQTPVPQALGPQAPLLNASSTSQTPSPTIMPPAGLDIVEITAISDPKGKKGRKRIRTSESS